MTIGLTVQSSFGCGGRFGAAECPGMEAVFQFLTYSLVGLGLAAACGFRVFVPLLVMGIAVRGGALELAEGWSWIGSLPALISFGVATLLEVAGFYIPWVDNVLDAAASPAAV